MARPKRICTVAGCERPHYGRGWCNMHYNRWYTGREIGGPEPLTSSAEHGTSGMYDNHGCRCDDCRRANAESHYAYIRDPAHPERWEKHLAGARQSYARRRARESRPQGLTG